MNASITLPVAVAWAMLGRPTRATDATLARLSTKFSENVLDSTNAFALYVEDASELAGIPEDVLQAARAAAEKDGKAGWKLSLQAPSYLAVIQYGDSRRLRIFILESARVPGPNGASA